MLVMKKNRDINPTQIYYSLHRYFIMKRIFLVCCAAGFAACAFAQNTLLIDMRQDVNLLRREVGELRLEVEQLRSENEALKRSINSLRSSSVGDETVRAQVSSAKAAMSAQNSALKREIIESVKKDIDNLAAQTDAAIQKLSRAINAREQVRAEVAKAKETFGTDYPKSGIKYVVKSGDSISKIARVCKSRERWIMDANEISDPRSLRVGAEIFVPQQ